jgi:hypothetical protein
MLSASCVIPVGLEVSPGESPQRPVIVAEECTPKFGELSYGETDMISVRLVVDDANLKDTIFAVIYSVNGSPDDPSRRRFLANVELTASDRTNLARRSGSLERVSVCSSGFALPGQMSWVKVMVSDRPFKTTGLNIVGVSDGGLTDEKYWVITCG